MKTSQPSPVACKLRNLATLLVGVTFLFWSGCATQRAVKEIVAESNAAMLAAQFADTELQPDPAGAGIGAADWQAVSRKIDAFILAHPDQPTAAGALRVRQAVLLLAHEQYELAREAFAQAKELKTERDKALKALAPHLIWWYEHSAQASWKETDRVEARKALAAFDAQIQSLQATPDIRDILAEMRVRMALKLVKEEQGENKRKIFVEALDHYAAIFTAEDLAALQQGTLKPDTPTISVTERRRIRALSVLARIRGLLASPGSLQGLTAEDLANKPFGLLVFGR